MSIIIHDFTKENWDEVRPRYSLGAFLGGSEAPIVNGTSSFGGGHSCMRRKLGLEEFPDLSDKLNVQRGLVLEPIFLDEAAKMLGVEIYKPECMLLNKEYPFMIADFDGVTVEPEPFIIEVKTTQSRSKIDLAKKGIVADDWLTQGDHYLNFTQFKGCPNDGEYFKGIIYVIAHHIHHPPILIEVLREERLGHMQDLVAKEKEFIDMFNEGIIPEPDGTRDSTESVDIQFSSFGEAERDATNEEAQMHKEYKDLTKLEGDIKSKKQAIRNKLKLKMGDEQIRKINGICYMKEYNSFKKELLVGKLKDMELSHLVDESVSSYKRLNII
tara:strand:- start:4028 stop:5008 length:981 start_codon:yes stop_codon:yes gene_type:complete